MACGLCTKDIWLLFVILVCSAHGIALRDTTNAGANAGDEGASLIETGADVGRRSTAAKYAGVPEPWFTTKMYDSVHGPYARRQKRLQTEAAGKVTDARKQDLEKAKEAWRGGGVEIKGLNAICEGLDTDCNGIYHRDKEETMYNLHPVFVHTSKPLLMYYKSTTQEHREGHTTSIPGDAWEIITSLGMWDEPKKGSTLFRSNEVGNQKLLLNLFAQDMSKKRGYAYSNYLFAFEKKSTFSSIPKSGWNVNTGTAQEASWVSAAGVTVGAVPAPRQAPKAAADFRPKPKPRGVLLPEVASVLQRQDDPLSKFMLKRGRLT